MKELTLLITAMLPVASAVVAAAVPHHAGPHVLPAKSKITKKSAPTSRQGAESTVTGYVSDSPCGLMHMSGMSDEKSCTLACLEGGGELVIADHDKKVYIPD